MLYYTDDKPPVTLDAIGKVFKGLGANKSGWIENFWLSRNGAVINDLVLIYPVEVIFERNETYEIGANFPQFFLIGDDSGGRLVLMKKTGEDKFYLIDSGSPFIEDSEVFSSMEDLVDAVIGEDTANADFGDIVSVGVPSPTASDVLAIKKALSLNVAVPELQKRLQVEGSLLCKGVVFVKYQAVLSSYRHLIKNVS